MSCILLPTTLVKLDLNTWPILPKNDWEYRGGYGVGDNTSIVSFLGHEVGLSFCSDNGNISVSLSHPMSKYWLSYLQPIWNEQNKGKCKSCHGSGWDGETYT